MIDSDNINPHDDGENKEYRENAPSAGSGFQRETIPVNEKILHDVGKIADKENIRLYAIGGYVRDYYLDRPRTDFDFTVCGDALEFAKLVGKRFRSKPVIFERFRTAMVPVGDVQLEFVGTRKEEYVENSRKPIVSEGTLEDDIRRRDFTVNTLAVSLNADTFGEITDIFNGIEDIRAGILRTPLDPETTFSDDPLRMLRAARFAAQLNFAIDPECLPAMKQMAERIKIISQERITDEIFKILKSPKPSIGFEILFETGLLKIVMPEIDNLAGVDIVNRDERVFAHKDVFRHSLTVLDNVAKVSDDVWLRFAALMHDVAKPRVKHFSEVAGWTFHGHEELGARWMKKIFRVMKLPLDKLGYVETLIRLHQRPMALVDDEVTDSAVRRLAFIAGDALEDLFVLCKADITTKNPNLSVKYLNNYERVARKVVEVQEKDKLREFQSPVRGEEIMETCGLRPSIAVGYIKSKIEDAILDGFIPNEYEAAREFFLAGKDAWLAELAESPVEKSRRQQ